MIEKIADTLYKTEYSYLDFLNHMMTECESGLVVDDGCPYNKCKSGAHPMTLNELRIHLVEECNKINMECNVCKE